MTKKIKNKDLNWLRAAVLGSNDGIVSVAGIISGVAGATVAKSSIITAGIAGLVAGALSMAAGEYVSVSSQKDAEENEHIDDTFAHPTQAALASAVSFTLGAIIPLIAVVLAPAHERLPILFIAVLVALSITGYLSGKFTNAKVIKATLRVVIWGAVAMAVTYAVGHFFKVHG